MLNLNTATPKEIINIASLYIMAREERNITHGRKRPEGRISKIKERLRKKVIKTDVHRLIGKIQQLRAELEHTINTCVYIKDTMSLGFVTSHRSSSEDIDGHKAVLKTITKAEELLSSMTEEELRAILFERE